MPTYIFQSVRGESGGHDGTELSNVDRFEGSHEVGLVGPSIYTIEFLRSQLSTTPHGRTFTINTTEGKIVIDLYRAEAPVDHPTVSVWGNGTLGDDPIVYPMYGHFVSPDGRDDTSCNGFFRVQQAD